MGIQHADITTGKTSVQKELEPDITINKMQVDEPEEEEEVYHKL